LSVFDPKSRYVKYARVATATDRRGRPVACLTPAEVPPQTELGRHRLRQGQRLDHLSDHYLGDPAGFWRIAEINDAMTAESALDEPLVAIPTRS
jgi:hypothetical protein